MKTSLLKAFGTSLIAILILQSNAAAQLARYSFTGTKFSGPYANFNRIYGNEIYGTITLDEAAAADHTVTLEPGVEWKLWFDGNFSINLESETGYAIGTALGGSTDFQDIDSPGNLYGRNTFHSMNWFQQQGTAVQRFTLSCYDAFVGDGIGAVPTSWNLMNYDYKQLEIAEYDFATLEIIYMHYYIDSFSPMLQNVVIEGLDTAVPNVLYQGKDLNQWLAEYEQEATNHGGFVSRVKQLATALRKSGKLTAAQSNELGNAAAQSSVQ